MESAYYTSHCLVTCHYVCAIEPSKLSELQCLFDLSTYLADSSVINIYRLLVCLYTSTMYVIHTIAYIFVTTYQCSISNATVCYIYI